jgi:hypothetical protein
LTPLRETFTFSGTTVTSDIVSTYLNSGAGMYCGYAGYTYHFVQRVLVDRPYLNNDGSLMGTSPEYQIWEYQYTHFKLPGPEQAFPATGAAKEMLGFYAAHGLMFDSYDFVGQRR